MLRSIAVVLAVTLSTQNTPQVVTCSPQKTTQPAYSGEQTGACRPMRRCWHWLTTPHMHGRTTTTTLASLVTYSQAKVTSAMLLCLFRLPAISMALRSSIAMATTGQVRLKTLVEVIACAFLNLTMSVEAWPAVATATVCVLCVLSQNDAPLAKA